MSHPGASRSIAGARLCELDTGMHALRNVFGSSVRTPVLRYTGWLLVQHSVNNLQAFLDAYRKQYCVSRGSLVVLLVRPRPKPWAQPKTRHDDSKQKKASAVAHDQRSHVLSYSAKASSSMPYTLAQERRTKCPCALRVVCQSCRQLSLWCPSLSAPRLDSVHQTGRSEALALGSCVLHQTPLSVAPWTPSVVFVASSRSCRSVVDVVQACSDVWST